MKNISTLIDKRLAIRLISVAFAFVFGCRASAQTINVPLSGGINPLYYGLPATLKGGEDNVVYVNVNGSTDKENYDTQCAQRALTHARQYINTYVGALAIKAGVDLGVKVGTDVAKLMPLGRGASLAVDLLGAALKASTAENLDDLSETLQKEALNQVGGKFTDDIENPATKKALDEGIGKLIDLMYKKMDDAAINKDFPNDCNGHLNVHFVKTAENRFKMVFKASGDCQCNNKEKPLGAWEVSGEMEATVVDIKPKSKLLQSVREEEYDMTLKWGTPTVNITADCNCNLHNTSYMPGGGENQAYAGVSLISEDSDPRFNTYGGEVAFTHFLNPQVGLTGDAGLNFGSQNMVDYRKFTIMAGITIIPLQQMALAAKVNLYAHALIGLAAINASIGTYSNTNTSFAGEVGAGINIPIKKSWSVRPIEVNYQFEVPKGLSSNFRFGAGIVANLPFGR
jgi:hypothetical protein